MVDYWPDQDGRIFDCFTVNAYAESTSITANYAVKLGTSTAGILKVTVCGATTDADGFGVALKTPVAVGDYIPVLLFGIVKMVVAGYGKAQTANQVLVGSLVVNSGVAGIHATGNANSFDFLNLSGASHILGRALQTGIVAADEVLVFVGKVL